jgi:muramidase (phage lysozyme)
MLKWFGISVGVLTSLAMSSMAFGGQPSLLAQQGAFAARGALIPAAFNRQDAVQTRRGASLFAGREGGGLFAAIEKPTPTPELEYDTRKGVAGLRDIIAKAEAGAAGYDAVVWSARIKTPKPPTQMTLGEIYTWIKATPNQNHAIGRYQFIPSTLRRVAKAVGAQPSDMFTPELQDRLAGVLLEDAGLSAFYAGELSQQGFMNNLAKIWAGLPTSTGRSYYHGYAGNKATMSWARFEAGVSQAFSG